MLRRPTALIAAAIAAATLAAPVPASAVDPASVTINPCRGDVGLLWEEWYQTVYVTGVLAPKGATDVHLTCGVVRYGETVARVSENLPGPVGVVQGSARVLKGPIGFCYEATVYYPDHYELLDTCP